MLLTPGTLCELRTLECAIIGLIVGGALQVTVTVTITVLRSFV